MLLPSQMTAASHRPGGWLSVINSLLRNSACLKMSCCADVWLL